MTNTASQPLFETVAFIGMGLIGSSMARRIKRDGLANKITCAVRSEKTRDRVLEIGIADEAYCDIKEAVGDADLVMICAPVGANEAIGAQLSGALKKGAIVSDVGSVKQSVIRDIAPHLDEGVHFVPGHPLAGTEHSGPDSGFPELFEERWCILTPIAGEPETATAKVKALWEACGMFVECMDADHHDRILGITSHLPHLIAYTIVGTATDLEDALRQEVIKFSATGFRDFTRIAASDPTMWRDVFLNNREAVLEVLGRFQEDLMALQRAIRWGEGDKLFDLFTRTREIRRGIVDAGQYFTNFSAEGENRQSDEKGKKKPAE
ncbi:MULTISPECIES: prephenate/arogenate dehydrogenase family protein [Thalassospira]|uniref:prephenate dehydrogenase n=2 Tax=Thalassospira TaxID=168934 RepID=A0A367WCC7_9PROT|nr:MULTISPECIES: prephenate/arogenate dehydrogenase family protein [Thalassospira]MDG4717500.1 prephenate/arogenate dehydrogenase family protein [Thalassospira sp. FZY0004]RCK39027.1 cyclohexadienyl dehydrogenase [Thalassospira profundimaris]